MPEPARPSLDLPASAGETSSGPEPIRRYELYLLGIVLAAFFALTWMSLAQKSVTVDEFVYVPAGLSHLRTGDFRLEAMNPPLLRMLAALPLAMSEVKLPLEMGWKSGQQWQMGYEFMAANAEAYQSIFVRARAVIVVLGALLVLLAWWWARSLYGRASGLAAAGLCAFCPNLMAHSGLATTDLGAAWFFLGALYAFWEFCRRPSSARGMGAGLLLGLALLAKFTSILLLPLGLLLGLGYRFAGGRPWNWRSAGPGLALLILVSWLTLCSGYFWHGFGTPLQAYPFQSQTWQRIAAAWPGKVPVPLPSDWIRGLDWKARDDAVNRGGYLFGRYSKAGWRSYYLVALLVKTPVPALLLLGLGLVSLRRLPRSALPDELFILLPPFLLLAAFSLFTHVNIGLRYVLPAYPFLYIIASRPLARLLAPRAWASAGIALLLGGQLLSNLLIFPDYLAYFNFAAGGPDQGKNILIDSNLDWGQDLIGLQRWLDAEKIDSICLAYFGRAEPAIYGIRATVPLPGRSCPLVAVSASLLMGKQDLLLDQGHPIWTRPEQFAWLRGEPPVKIIGHSIYVFRPASPVVPAGPPAPASAR